MNTLGLVISVFCSPGPGYASRRGSSLCKPGMQHPRLLKQEAALGCPGGEVTKGWVCPRAPSCMGQSDLKRTSPYEGNIFPFRQVSSPSTSGLCMESHWRPRAGEKLSSAWCLVARPQPQSHELSELTEALAP